MQLPEGYFNINQHYLGLAGWEKCFENFVETPGTIVEGRNRKLLISLIELGNSTFKLIHTHDFPLQETLSIWYEKLKNDQSKYVKIISKVDPITKDVIPYKDPYPKIDIRSICNYIESNKWAGFGTVFCSDLPSYKVQEFIRYSNRIANSRKRK